MVINLQALGDTSSFLFDALCYAAFERAVGALVSPGTSLAVWEPLENPVYGRRSSAAVFLTDHLGYWTPCVDAGGDTVGGLGTLGAFVLFGCGSLRGVQLGRAV